MRHLLLASSCIAALAAPVAAETPISTPVTGPVRTSTVKAGTPDDILITSTGKVTSGGVIIDSNHKLNNQGSIEIGSVNGAVGVDVNAGVTSGITNSGKIIVDEAYTPTDSDNDGDLDGPFATGSGRIGIRTNGSFTGNIVNSGTITIEGNNSAGILLGGPLTGTFRHDGTTTPSCAFFPAPGRATPADQASRIFTALSPLAVAVICGGHCLWFHLTYEVTFNLAKN